jgi:uncharacterized protein (TIRG00374 family)
MIVLSLALILLALGVAWFLIDKIPDLLPVLKRATFLNLTFACTLILGNYLLRIQRWRLYLATVGQYPTFGISALAFITGLVGCMTPGKVGELVRCWSGSRYGIPWHITLATLGVERVADLIVIVLLAICGTLTVNTHQFTPLIIFIAIFLLVISMFLRREDLREIVSHIPIVGRKLKYGTPEIFWAVIQKSHIGRVYWQTFTLGAMGWLLEVACLYLIGSSITSSLSLITCFAAFGFGVLAGAASMLPGGLGTVEAVMTSIMVWSGCSLVDSIAIAIVFRLCNLWFGVLLGAIAVLAQTFFQISNKGKTCSNG